MAKKQTIITENIPDDELKRGVPPEGYELSEEEETLHDILQNFGPVGVHLKVYKIPPTGKPMFCFDAANTIDEAEIQSRYGGGKYAIRVYIDKKLKDTVYTDIAEPVMAKNNDSSANIHQVMVTMLQQQNAQMTNMMMAMLGRPTPLTNPSPIGDTIQLFNLMKGNQPLTGDSLVSKIVERALDSLDDKTSGGDWKTELLKTVREAIPSIAQVLTPAMNPAMNVTPNVNISPNPNGNGNGNMNQPPAIAAPPNDDELLAHLLASIKPKILIMPAGLALDWIITNAQDPQFLPILRLALTKTPEDVAKIDPDFAKTPYKEWITEVIEGVKAEYSNQSKD